MYLNSYDLLSAIPLTKEENKIVTGGRGSRKEKDHAYPRTSDDYPIWCYVWK